MLHQGRFLLTIQIQSRVESFTKNTFTEMIKGITEEALAKKLISKNNMEKGVADLLKTASGGGIFSYTFFKSIGTKYI